MLDAISGRRYRQNRRQLRAGPDWGAIAAEYLHGEPPSTPLGEAEAAFLARRGRTTSAAL